MNKIVNPDRIDLYNNLYGLETLHPLVTVVDLREAKSSVRGIQLDAAIELLLDDYLRSGLAQGGVLPTAEVARRLGFASVQYFSLLFKKVNRVAPNEYRATQN